MDDDGWELTVEGNRVTTLELGHKVAAIVGMMTVSVVEFMPGNELVLEIVGLCDEKEEGVVIVRTLGVLVKIEGVMDIEKLGLVLATKVGKILEIEVGMKAGDPIGMLVGAIVEDDVEIVGMVVITTGDALVLEIVGLCDEIQEGIVFVRTLGVIVKIVGDPIGMVVGEIVEDDVEIVGLVVITTGDALVMEIVGLCDEIQEGVIFVR